MKLILFFVGAMLPFQAHGSAAVGARSPLALQAATRAADQVTSRITVTLPQDPTELSVEGNVIPGTGASRAFETSRLEGGRTYRYTFTATWQPNSYTKMTRTKIVSFRAGERLTVDLSMDDPTDRVEVIFVPTPDDVVDAMVKLAGVSARDVVYEPGCGDARITIAAVRSGARKGVGIDIDADR